MKYYPERFLDYLLYRAENYSTVEWEAAAAKAWLDIDQIKTLMEGPEGEQLFQENIKRAMELKIDSSPTLLIDGK